MKLYDIDTSILDCFDPETGELINTEAFGVMSANRDDKIESLAVTIKNLKSDAEELMREIRKLTQRKNAAENMAERIKELLKYELGGEKFRSTRASVYYLPSEAVEFEITEDDFVEWAINSGNTCFLKRPEVSRSEIKKALKQGVDVPGARIEKKSNIVIK